MTAVPDPPSPGFLPPFAALAGGTGGIGAFSSRETATASLKNASLRLG